MAPAGAAGCADRELRNYTLLARLATGGMAEIYAGCLTGAAGFEKIVAIKQLLPHLAEDAQAVSMFLEEARILARLSHPNICQVFDLGEEDDDYFIAMEYLSGVTLSSVIRALSRPRTRLELRVIAGLFQQACAALHHVHELRDPDGSPAGVIHRDVSPRNLLVTVDGVLKLLDFGLAKSYASPVHTQTGQVKGTTAYMSPEQIAGETLDRRSDVFSLGVILHELVTGDWLFRRESKGATYQAIREDTLPGAAFPDPAAGAAGNTAILRALARDRGQRFATVAEFEDAVADAFAPLGGPLPPSAIAAWVNERFGDELATRRRKLATAFDRTMGAADPTRQTGASPAARPGTGRSLITESLGPDERERQQSAPGDPPTLSTRERGPRPPGRGVRRGRAPLVVAFLLGAVPTGVLAAVAAGGGGGAPPATATPAAAGARADAGPPAAAVAIRQPGPASAARPRDAAVALAAPADAAPTRGSAPRIAEGASGRAAGRGAGRTPRRARPPPDSAPPANPPQPGTFTIDSHPYARIFVDGDAIGITPLLEIPLEPGRHRVRAVTSDGRAKAFTIEIEAGREAPRRMLEW